MGKRVDTQENIIKSLSGIWKNSGFEKIPDLDRDINSVRKEIGDNILDKSFD